MDDAHVGATLVTEMSKEFDLNSVSEVEGSLMASLPVYRPSQTMAVQSMGPLMEIREHVEMESDADSDEGEEEMEADEALEEGDTVSR